MPALGHCSSEESKVHLAWPPAWTPDLSPVTLGPGWGREEERRAGGSRRRAPDADTRLAVVVGGFAEKMPRGSLNAERARNQNSSSSSELRCKSRGANIKE